MIHKGGCHCQNVRYQFHTEFTIESIPIRRCSCSFCEKAGPNYSSDPEGKLVISCKNENKVIRYRFGTQTAEFITCQTCGSFLFALCDINQKTRAVLNLNSLDEKSKLTWKNIKTNCFDSETKDSRLDRRSKNWIGTVEWEPHQK